MERIFEPKTEQEIELVKIIKTDKVKNNRKKALIKLLLLNGFQKNELYAIQIKEYYERIPNKPVGWNRFRTATIFYDDCRLKR